MGLPLKNLATNSANVKVISNALLFFGFLILFLMVLFLLPMASAPAESQPQLPAAVFLSQPATGSVIEVSSKMLAQGLPSIVYLSATVPPTATLNAFTIHVEYDPTIIEYQSCAVASPFLGVCNQSNGDGVPPDVVSFSAVHPSGANGMLDLGSINITALMVGTSPLHLVVETWSDGNPNPPITIDGQVIVVPPHTATPGPTPTGPTSTPTATSTNAATSTPTSTPNATPPTPTGTTIPPTPTPGTSPTPTPSNTPTTTATATPTATATMSPEEDYLIYLPITLKE